MCSKSSDTDEKWSELTGFCFETGLHWRPTDRGIHLRRHDEDSILALCSQKSQRAHTEIGSGNKITECIKYFVWILESISSTFYLRVFRTKDLFFCQNVTREKHFRTKNTCIKRWWNWRLVGANSNNTWHFKGMVWDSVTKCHKGREEARLGVTWHFSYFLP